MSTPHFLNTYLFKEKKHIFDKIHVDPLKINQFSSFCQIKKTFLDILIKLCFGNFHFSFEYFLICQSICLVAL